MQLMSDANLGEFAVILEFFGALLNAGMICPHPQSFSPGRRELEFLNPLPKAKG